MLNVNKIARAANPIRCFPHHHDLIGHKRSLITIGCKFHFILILKLNNCNDLISSVKNNDHQIF